MASFFSSHKYSKLPASEDEYSDIKMSYQYTTSPFTSSTRANRSDSSGSYSSVASSDSAYEAVAPRQEDLAFYDIVNGKYDTNDKTIVSNSANGRKVRFALEKDLPALPREASTKKPRRVSSREGAYAWFAQRRFQVEDHRLEDSMERRNF
ncbi:hypothetical protein B0O99DRAFT_623845 [Bisporella sp. PMI_857]|nr:hypothetical protein B0O99DRAFT_623845 [Bisporella sp. PMI_857]